jgi:hypothetical protein
MPQAPDRQPHFVLQVREVLAADIAQLDPLEQVPNPLVRVQLGRVRRELLDWKRLVAPAARKCLTGGLWTLVGLVRGPARVPATQVPSRSVRRAEGRVMSRIGRLRWTFRGHRVPTATRSGRRDRLELALRHTEPEPGLQVVPGVRPGRAAAGPLGPLEGPGPLRAAGLRGVPRRGGPVDELADIRTDSDAGLVARSGVPLDLYQKVHVGVDGGAARVITAVDVTPGEVADGHLLDQLTKLTSATGPGKRLRPDLVEDVELELLLA